MYCTCFTGDLLPLEGQTSHFDDCSSRCLGGFGELVKYNTLKPEDKQNRSKEYIDCKKEGQNDNYDITGEITAPECLNFDKDIVHLEKNVGKYRHQAVPYPHQQRRREQCTQRTSQSKRTTWRRGISF